MSSDPTLAEYMVISLARGLRDGEWGACGAYSAIPMAAFMLARREHAPNLWWLSGGSGALNPRCVLMESSSNHWAWQGAEAVFDIEDIVDYEFGGWRRRPTVGLFGGIQVDRRGSVNMIGIGQYPKLTFRGPGTVGLAFAAHFSRTMIYLNNHSERGLVEEVAYVSGPGHTASRGLHVDEHSKGPALIVTPQAVFDFDEHGQARLASITPGHSENEVREHTGFEFAAVKDLAETKPPTPGQLEVIRTELDPRGILQRVKLATW